MAQIRPVERPRFEKSPSLHSLVGSFSFVFPGGLWMSNFPILVLLCNCPLATRLGNCLNRSRSVYGSGTPRSMSGPLIARACFFCRVRHNKYRRPFLETLIILIPTSAAARTDEAVSEAEQLASWTRDYLLFTLVMFR